MKVANYASALLLAATAGIPSPLFSQTSSPNDSNQLLYGTWVLDLDRSIFIEREAPYSQVLVYAPHETGLEATVIFTDKDGVENTITYVDAPDSDAAQLRGSENFDTMIMETTSRYHATTTFTHAGMVVGHAQRTISLDGQEMRVEVERNGNLSSRAVFVKQE